ncbi:unnamed protein product [Adineta ricciae]|uniref:Uncharacterized protein n=1 Tax=Adineta ricciae TaxID=249248 RepID=A0A815H1A8_ADIRI|nr:unnamed protein product [Adineta ricciae]
MLEPDLLRLGFSTTSSSFDDGIVFVIPNKLNMNCSVTTLYVMEPWERYLVLTIAFLVITLVTYSAIVFIPFHVGNIIRSTVPSLTDILLQ